MKTNGLFTMNSAGRTVRLGFLFFLSAGCVLLMIGCNETEVVTDRKLQVINEFAAAEVKIERLRKQTPPDWDAVSLLYEKAAPLVKETDSQEALDYDRTIRAALEKCKAGDDVKVNQQMPAKGLQHVAVLGIRRNLHALAKTARPELNARHTDRIAAYFEGIRPTFTRRDNDFFPTAPTLEPGAIKALARLKQADAEDLIGAGRNLEAVIARTYALSVLFEVLEIEKLRDSDTEACRVKRAEALIFYRILALRIQTRIPALHAEITAMLNAPFAQMDAQRLEVFFMKAGIGMRN